MTVRRALIRNQAPRLGSDRHGPGGQRTASDVTLRIGPMAEEIIVTRRKGAAQTPRHSAPAPPPPPAYHAAADPCRKPGGSAWRDAQEDRTTGVVPGAEGGR